MITNNREGSIKKKFDLCNLVWSVSKMYDSPRSPEDM